MDEKASPSSRQRWHALHSEDAEAVARRPAGTRRSGCLVAAAALALALAALLLLVSASGSTGRLCRHVRLLRQESLGPQAPAWAGRRGAPLPDHSAVISSHDDPDDPPAGPGVGAPVVLRRQSANVTTTSATATATVLEDFEVHQPVLTPSGATLDDGDSTGGSSSAESSCSVVLMDYVFAYSYGTPFVGNYTPPDCDFNRVVINYTVVSEGRQ